MIQITKEQLLKSGFKETEGNIYYDFFVKDDFKVFIHKEDLSSVFLMWKGCQIDHTVNNLDFSKMQRIYHALTNDEF